MIGQEIQRFEKKRKADILQQWRVRLRTSQTAAVRWLRSKPQLFQHDMFDDGIEDVANAPMSTDQALENIFLFGAECGNALPCTENVLRRSIWISGRYRKLSPRAFERGWVGSELAALPLALWQDLLNILYLYSYLYTLPKGRSYVVYQLYF